MTDTDWSAELAVGCDACDAPAGEPCVNDQGHPVPWIHIDRISDAASHREAAVPEPVQPDPQVVAWMRERMSEEPYGTTAKDVRAYREANGLSAEDMDAAFHEAIRKPLTVTDIPAGQGAASLFLKRDDRGYVDLFEKGADGGVAKILDLDEHSAALADHLAATLPTVTDTPDLTPLFDTPQVTTDTAGRHWHDGHECDAVTVDGELTYTPKPTDDEEQL